MNNGTSRWTEKYDQRCVLLTLVLAPCRIITLITTVPLIGGNVPRVEPEGRLAQHGSLRRRHCSQIGRGSRRVRRVARVWETGLAQLGTNVAFQADGQQRWAELRAGPSDRAVERSCGTVRSELWPAVCGTRRHLSLEVVIVQVLRQRRGDEVKQIRGGCSPVASRAAAGPQGNAAVEVAAHQPLRGLAQHVDMDPWRRGCAVVKGLQPKIQPRGQKSGPTHPKPAPSHVAPGSGSSRCASIARNSCSHWLIALLYATQMLRWCALLWQRTAAETRPGSHATARASSLIVWAAACGVKFLSDFRFSRSIL